MPACGIDTRLLLRTRALEVTDEMVENAGRCALRTTAPQMNLLLRDAIYNHRACSQIVAPALMVWAVLAVVCIVIGGNMDTRRKEAARHTDPWAGAGDAIPIQPSRVRRWLSHSPEQSA